MSDDERSFEERNQSYFINHTGGDWSPEQATKNFMLNGPAQRAEGLDLLDREIANAGPVSSGSNDFRAAADRLVLRRELGELHRKMLAVNR
ncbi:hypothetical protein [Bradyrhizobium erythrophlei]|uniref:Uncharacterized protein n=1 Tax=Bradyrhizobium erythrophlei TaxID=1437360 RepID=A0A1H4NHJ1_9BRAD|nr:hypothetical protein [Bradyrhizobium erythrophlei]SEB94686.1 hypothetical protein SAMN05444164_0632 [Bradyrhizobium erythrophlei]